MSTTSTNNYRRFYTRHNSVRLIINHLQSLHPKNRPERGGTRRRSLISCSSSHDDTAKIPVFYAVPLLPRSPSQQTSRAHTTPVHTTSARTSQPHLSQAQEPPRPNTIRRRPVPASSLAHRDKAARSRAMASTGTHHATETVVHLDADVVEDSPPITPKHGHKKGPSTATYRSARLNRSAALDRSEEVSPQEADKAERKCRRDARRSFRESGDWLGVQGVNPRTGRKDPSEITTTTLTASTFLPPATLRGSRAGSACGSLDMEGSLDLGSVGTGIRVRVEEKRREVKELRSRYLLAKGKFKREVSVIKRERRERKHNAWKTDVQRRHTGSEGAKKRRDPKWMLSETGWNSVFSPDATPSVEFEAGRDSNWKGEQQGYFDVCKSRHMSIIPESPRAWEKEVIRDVRDVRDGVDVKVGFEEFRRRCRRHRRSFK